MKIKKFTGGSEIALCTLAAIVPDKVGLVVGGMVR